mmetsp:Transcript_23184/g.72426  ORF Transcript_23184/g.72426 Transcript_23184/m.72426 type:complete len:345 (-) Transcript_23184:41-1075(-)
MADEENPAGQGRPWPNVGAVNDGERRGIFERIGSMMEGENGLRNKMIIKSALAVCGMLCLLMLILLPMSFGNVEYYEYAFKKNRNTGRVNTDKVYDMGRYLVGPSITMKKFQASAHILWVEDVRFLSNQNLEMTINVQFAYFLREDELVELHEKLDINYKEPIKNRAVDPIKSAGPEFPTQEFFSNRTHIEKALGLAVANRLSELHADVKYFQLGAVQVPDEVKQRQLDNAIQVENNQLAELVKESELIREETRTLVNKINNNATLIQKTAAADAGLLIAQAQTRAQDIVSQARSGGLQKVYTALGITEGKHKASLDYIRTLAAHPTARLKVNFNDKVPLIGVV